jgi:hypothetical protein
MSAPLIVGKAGRYQTTCRLCDRPIAESDPLDIPLIGDPGKKAGQITAVMVRHMTKYHLDAFKMGAAIAQEISTFPLLAAFNSEDPTFTARAEQTRASIFALVRKNTMTDAHIDHLVTSFGLDPEAARQVTQGMRALRDACCELGQFAPSLPPEVRSLLLLKR